MQAIVRDLTEVSSIEYDYGLDIDLAPIKEGIIELLERLDTLSYPAFITDVAPFLPKISLNCVRKYGIQYLNRQNQTSLSVATSQVSGFFKEILNGCAADG